MTTYLTLHVVCGLTAIGLMSARNGGTSLLMGVACVTLGPVALGEELGMLAKR